MKKLFKKLPFTVMLLCTAWSSVSFTACSLAASFVPPEAHINSCKFDQTSLSLEVGRMESISLSVSVSNGNQDDISVSWEYDSAVIRVKKDNYGMIITALAAGTTIVRATVKDQSATCVVSVTAPSAENQVVNPYVYVSDDYVAVLPGETQKVSASLYGGIPSDINGFTWTIDKPSVASLSAEGNYCRITGVSEGIAKITARHTKSAFGYTFLVSCSADSSTVSYLTTDTNIITINKSEITQKSFCVELANPLSTAYESLFEYSITDEKGASLSSAPISISAAGKECAVTALSGGSCYVKVTHPAASYSLDVLIRVTENIDTVYIEPSASLVTVTGTAADTITVSLANILSETVNVNDYSWSFPAGTENIIDYQIYGGDISGYGDSLWITGKKTGTVRVTVSHPLAPQSRTIVIVVRDISSQASKATTYITTSQNYIQTKTGDEDTRISIYIKNARAGDESGLSWNIVNTADDGSSDPVIKYVSGTGTATSSSSRSAITTAAGEAVITPLKAGDAVITISHPDAVYDTKILVTVLPSDTDCASSFSLSAPVPILYIQNGNSCDVSVLLSGTNKSDADDRSIVWTAASAALSITPNGNTASVAVTGSGGAFETITVTHPRVSYPLTLSIVRYDTEEDIADGKGILSDNPYYKMYEGQKTYLHISGIGLTDSDSITWNVVSGLNSVVSFTQEDSYTACVTALAAGDAQITAQLTGCTNKVTFYVAVKKAGIINEDLPCYITTAQNVVSMTAGDSADVTVTPVNISQTRYSDLVWTNSNPDLVTVSFNGTGATFIAVASGKATITVTHPLSANTLTISVHIGSIYEYWNTDVAYISSSVNTLELISGDKPSVLTVLLAHTESSDVGTRGFTFESKNTSIFTVDYSHASNYCNITPVGSGQAFLTIHHDDSKYDKEVLIIVKRSSAETGDIPFISTTKNVITVIAGEHTSATVTLKNAVSHNAASWSWLPLDTAIVNIVANNGASAMISGLKPGTTKIMVSNSDCSYPLQLIIICLDSNVVQSSPWIQSSSNIVTLQKNKAETITAEVIGGSASDFSGFVWSCADPSIAFCSGSANSVYVKGLTAGLTYITVRNSYYEDAYSKTILVLVEDTTVKDCFISLTQKIVKLKPTDTAGTTIIATLENGKPLDAQEFVWWADDYNIVDLVSNTDTAVITATGVSGTTTVHVKHPKVLVTYDIVVMVAVHDSFAFEGKSKTIQNGSLSFVPMQIPATTETSWIEYSSLNSNVCAVTGSNTVCMLAGVSAGYTSVQASLVSSSGIIATADMAVIVSAVADTANKITSQTTILNMEPGTSRTLEAALCGSSVTSLDYYDISWTSSDSSVLSILTTENNITKGKNAYVTAKKAGEAVITISHAKCEADLQIWVLVPAQNETGIQLDQTYLELYKDDGAVSVSATLINGSASDYNNITWTAPKVGGQVIVSVSKATGKTCNIVPRNVGQTTLRAQLPNGVHADCIVSVTSAAEITLSTKAVHVNPGYCETISYSASPENAKINWISQGTGSSDPSDYFTFYVNEAAKTITITGIKLGSGSLTGYFSSASGGSTARLAVYVEYSYDFSLKTSGILHAEPRNGTSIKIPFTVYPHNLEVTASVSADSKLEVKSISLDTATGKGVVTVTPLGESKGLSVTLKATNPDDLVNTPLIQTQYIDLYYKSLTITPVFDFGSGAFTCYDGETLFLGDGEETLFHLDVAEENANISGLTVSWQNVNGSYPDNTENITCEKENISDSGKTLYRIKHSTDYKTDNAYLITKDMYFTIKEYASSVHPIYPGFSHIFSSDIINPSSLGTVISSVRYKTSPVNEAIYSWAGYYNLSDDIYGGLHEDGVAKALTAHRALTRWTYSYDNWSTTCNNSGITHIPFDGSEQTIYTDRYGVTCSYSSVTPYVVSSDVFTSNANYYSQQLEAYWWKGLINSQSGIEYWDAKQFHKYATKTITKDTSAKLYSGQIVISYYDYSGSPVEPVKIPVTITVRQCEAYSNGQWTYNKALNRWTQN